jgi:sec-independent protein translocase protein TatA
MAGIGPMELIVALLVLGPKRLPEAGRSVGTGIREFKASLGSPSDEQEAAPAGDVKNT